MNWLIRAFFIVMFIVVCLGVMLGAEALVFMVCWNTIAPAIFPVLFKLGAVTFTQSMIFVVVLGIMNGIASLILGILRLLFPK